VKYLIIGLGNPGVEYENTRHNIGFRVLNAFISASKTSFKTNRYADVSELKFKGRKLVFIKPSTFMNLSGKAVNYWMQQSKIEATNILVVTDDISLPFGVLRMRKKGSDGGHNGLKDINSVIGNNNYSRLRFGIGNDFQKGKQADYVLSDFTDVDNESIKERINLAIMMIKGFVTIGIDQTMSEFNGK